MGKHRHWAEQHRDLLRRALCWPLVWRLAHNFIIANLPHDDTLTGCLVCEAGARKKKVAHVLTMNQNRQLYCKKCGLPLFAWQKECANNGKAAPPAPVKRSPVTVIPLNWD